MIPVELVGVFDNAGNLVSLAPKTGKPGPKVNAPAIYNPTRTAFVDPVTGQLYAALPIDQNGNAVTNGIIPRTGLLSALLGVTTGGVGEIAAATDTDALVKYTGAGLTGKPYFRSNKIAKVQFYYPTQTLETGAKLIGAPIQGNLNYAEGVQDAAYTENSGSTVTVSWPNHSVTVGQVLSFTNDSNGLLGTGQPFIATVTAVTTGPTGTVSFVDSLSNGVQTGTISVWTGRLVLNPSGYGIPIYSFDASGVVQAASSSTVTSLKINETSTGVTAIASRSSGYVAPYAPLSSTYNTQLPVNCRSIASQLAMGIGTPTNEYIVPTVTLTGTGSVTVSSGMIEYYLNSAE